MIKRKLEDQILRSSSRGKAIILLGPRQSGKTTLMRKLLSAEDYLFIDCDDPLSRTKLQNANTESIRQIIGKHKYVFIDEAQRVKNIGLTLKIITDQFKHIQLMVSGSSSLDLQSEINEPMTGRKIEYFLYPVSWSELLNETDYLTAHRQLETRIIYGMYPEIVNNPGGEKELLKQLSSSYLYKDILAYQNIRKPEILEKLLTALALQLGSEVSYNELGRLVQVDKNTVSNYMNLLEKAFVIFRLNPLRRNLRSEIGTSRKIYFYDTGIRNALISNFNTLELRNDVGALWENFMICERMKHNHYSRTWVNYYFWRTKDQQEIDFIEESEGKLRAYEFKWNPYKIPSVSKTFKKAYPDSTSQVINRDNFNEFITP
ncbi:MAG: ATP-binding protein [Bacteroidales bacterium]|nr:ATP-binding protein [Bacteroidales bacterium]